LRRDRHDVGDREGEAKFDKADTQGFCQKRE